MPMTAYIMLQYGQIAVNNVLISTFPRFTFNICVWFIENSDESNGELILSDLLCMQLSSQLPTTYILGTLCLILLL
jgi:hypothetical protein